MVTITSNMVDDFVEHLGAKSQRYQLRLEDDFMICVRPDGSKQWLYTNQRHRNSGFARVLGDFPAMKLSQARIALESARRSDQLQLAAVEPKESDPDDRIMQRFITTTIDLDGTVESDELALVLSAPIDEDLKHPTLVIVEQQGPLMMTTVAAVAAVAVMVWWFFFDRSMAISKDLSASNAPISLVQDQGAVLNSPAYTALDGSAAELVNNAAKNQTTLSTAVASETATLPNKIPKPTSQSIALSAMELATSNVTRHQLARSISEREPAGSLPQEFAANDLQNNQVFYFSEVEHLAGQRIIHRWLRNNEVVAEIPFTIGANGRWRVYSHKTVLDWMTGNWQAQVVRANGEILASESFTVK